MLHRDFLLEDSSAEHFSLLLQHLHALLHIQRCEKQNIMKRKLKSASIWPSLFKSINFFIGFSPNLFAWSCRVRYHRLQTDFQWLFCLLNKQQSRLVDWVVFIFTRIQICLFFYRWNEDILLVSSVISTMRIFGWALCVTENFHQIPNAKRNPILNSSSDEDEVQHTSLTSVFD